MPKVDELQLQKNVDTLGHFAESKSILKGLSINLKSPIYLDVTVLQKGITCSRTKSDPDFFLC